MQRVAGSNVAFPSSPMPSGKAAALLHKYDPLDVEQVRNKLVEDKEQAVGHLCWAGLDHASDAFTHTDEKILLIFSHLHQIDKKRWVTWCEKAKTFTTALRTWIWENPWKCLLLVVGLGASAYKFKTILQVVKSSARGFISWGQSVSTPMRFFGFCVLMTVRLIVSTLVPPTSPAFGLILQAATPESEKWTAMPLFLAASTVAGTMPYIMDKIMECFSGKDFKYTDFMHWFASIWPLTCWTAPTMMMVFYSTGGGKMGASLAVIVAHAAPFMGAQTTNMQRHFLPHPLDTIISQPFGMSEDLLSMAMAEATTNPALGSFSLTLLIAGLNFARYAVFTRMKDKKACASAVLNVMIGLLVLYAIYTKEEVRTSNRALLSLVLIQLVIQIFLTPILARFIAAHLHEHERRKGENEVLAAENKQLRGSFGERQLLLPQQQSRLVQELQERELDVQRLERECQRLSSHIAQMTETHKQHVGELHQEFNRKFASETQRHRQALIQQQAQIEELQNSEKKYKSVVRKYEQSDVERVQILKKLQMEKFELQQKVEDKEVKEVKNEKLSKRLADQADISLSRKSLHSPPFLKKSESQSEVFTFPTGVAPERAPWILPAPAPVAPGRYPTPVASIQLPGRIVRARTLSPAHPSSPHRFPNPSGIRTPAYGGAATPAPYSHSGVMSPVRMVSSGTMGRARSTPGLASLP